MSKRSFLEEELIREARMRQESVQSSFSQLLAKARNLISPSQEPLGKTIDASLTAAKYGFVIPDGELNDPNDILILRAEILQSVNDEKEIPGTVYYPTFSIKEK